MAIKIEILDPKIDPRIKEVERFAKILDQVADSQERLIGQTDQLSQGYAKASMQARSLKAAAARTRAGGASGGYMGAGGSVPRAPRAPSSISPVAQGRFIMAQARAGLIPPHVAAQAIAGLHSASIRAAQSSPSTGNFNAASSLANMSARAQAASNPRTPPTAWDRFNKAAQSSRFGAGGMMPLMGQTLDIMGLSKLAGPVAIAVTAIQALGAAANAGAANLRNANSFRTGGGSLSPGEIEAAKRAGYPLGLGPEDIVDRAKSLQDQVLNGDPYLRSRLRKMGVDALPGAGRDPNRLKEFNDFMGGLDKMPERERTKLLQDLGMEDLGQKYSNAAGASGTRNLNSIKGEAQDILNNISGVITDLLFGQSGPSGLIPGSPSVSKEDKNTRAIEQNTRAVVEHTAAIKGIAEVAGGGSRASSAVPSGALGTFVQANQEAFRKSVEAGL